MHVAVVGGGMAGLAAAWKLKQAGVRFTLLDANPDLGGRCRTFEWNGRWLIRGAAAFVGAEENLIAQAKVLGVYSPDRIADWTPQHVHEIPKNGKVHLLKQFAAPDILMSSLVPAGEKLALGRVLPNLLQQLARSNGADPESAADLDTISACGYFREHSPAFVDYILEPIMNMFCGYGEDDYSLAWLVWLMASKYAWANTWWSFAERGVGELSQEMEKALRPTGGVVTDARVAEVRRVAAGYEVAYSAGGKDAKVTADAVVMAVPGSQVAPLLPDLDAARRTFFSEVKYVGHHIVYRVLDGVTAKEPMRLILPTAEGYEYLSNISVSPVGGGKAWVYGEIKGAACAKLAGASDDVIWEHAMAEAVRAFPVLASARVVDSYVQRNDIALCSRHVGYTKALAAFKKLAPLDRMAFAGDYLLNSSVGSAHRTGTDAAQQILAQLGVGQVERL